MKEYDSLISAEELYEYISSDQPVQIIDVRFSLADKELGRKEYAESHIPGAIYLHLDDDLSDTIIPGKTGRHPMLDQKKIAERLGNWGISNDHQIVVYDHSHGGIAARLWWMMHWLGHSKTAVLNGGWERWNVLNYPVDREIPDPTSTLFRIKESMLSVVNLDQVDQFRNDDEYLLIDARAAERYRGEVEPIDPVAGHIPGAVNKPFLTNLNDKGLFKDPDELKEEWQTFIGDYESNHIVCYCGSGVTACHNILAMKYAGLNIPKLYPGSWSEWITQKT